MSATGKRPNSAPFEPTPIESLMPEKMLVVEWKMIEGAETSKSVYVIMAIDKKQKPNREAKRRVQWACTSIGAVETRTIPVSYVRWRHIHLLIDILRPHWLLRYCPAPIRLSTGFTINHLRFDLGIYRRTVSVFRALREPRDGPGCNL
jgi:hypothetical protein